MRNFMNREEWQRKENRQAATLCAMIGLLAGDHTRQFTTEAIAKESVRQADAVIAALELSKEDLHDSNDEGYIDIMFVEHARIDGFPELLFVDIEDENKRVIKVGEWIDDEQPYKKLRIPRIIRNINKYHSKREET